MNNMKNKRISFLLSKVYEDGTNEDAQIVPVNELPWEDLKVNRRGFLGAGLVASAALLFLDSCSTGKNLNQNCQKGMAHKGNINTLLFSKDGKILISESDDFYFKFWKISEGALMKSLKESGMVQSVGQNPEGNAIVFINTQPKYGYWNLSNDGSKTKLFDTGKTGNAKKVVFSPNNQIIAYGTEGGNIEIKDARTGNIDKVLYGHKSGLYFLEISSDGKFMVSAGHQDIIVWETTRYKLICSIQAHQNKISGLYICPDGKSFITSGNDGKIKQWSLPHGNLIKLIENKNSDAIDSLAGNQQGTLLATSENMEITLWNLPDFSPRGKLTGHTNRIYSLAISPDGNLLASGSKDGRIRLWKLPEGTSLPCLIDLECSPNSVKGNRYTTINEYGQEITYTMPCGSPLPPGARCVCNCVPGSIKPPAKVRTTTSWSRCSCYPQHCVCVPVYR